jgi:hypothetical protein
MQPWLATRCGAARRPVAVYLRERKFTQLCLAVAWLDSLLDVRQVI